MPALNRPSRRDVAAPEPSTSTLAVTFFALLFVAIALAISLIHLRRRRLAQEQGMLPAYQPTDQNSPFGRSGGPFVYSSCPRSSPVPEIRVTFPDDDDQDGSGSQKYGRVMVVHVTDTGSVGMSPLDEEQLPPYERGSGDGFHSLDLNRSRDLGEKEAMHSQR